MKLNTYVPLIALLFLLGCKAVDKLTQFNLDYNETITIPASSIIDVPLTILTPEVETNTESEFASNDTRKDKIEEIKLTAMTLSVLSPENGDFGFLKSVSVSLVADGLDEIQIAWKDAVPEDAGNILDLETTDKDLKEYIKKDAFKLRVSVTTDEVTTSEYKIDVYSNFFVDAKVLGI